MTQEEKFLLLQDLCARLPYGVRLKIGEHSDYTLCGIVPKREHPVIVRLIENEREYDIDVYVESIKPYLRPMSSMTKEEINELKKLCTFYIPSDSKTIGFEDYGILVVTHHITNNTHSFKLNIQVIDWLNKHHFDFRNLIERGLAIDCTGLNVY